MSENPLCPTCERPGRYYKGDTFVCPRCESTWTVRGWGRSHELMDKRQNYRVTRALELTFRELYTDQKRLCDWCKSPMYDDTRGLLISFEEKRSAFICLKCADDDEKWMMNGDLPGVNAVEKADGRKRCRGCNNISEHNYLVYFDTYRKASYCATCLLNLNISAPRRFEKGDTVKLNGRVANIAGFNLSHAWPILQFRDDPTRLCFAKDFSVYDLEEL